MKKLVQMVSMMGLLGMLAMPVSAGEVFDVDAGHSAVIFAIKHMNVSYAYGRFNAFEGKIDYNEANPSASTFELTIDVASIDTYSERRDKHLRSTDFFSATQFPKIVFKSSKVEASGNNFKVSGNMDVVDPIGNQILTGRTNIHGTQHCRTVDVGEIDNI